ncbi:MAG: helix-turn-helix domain-containing protein [Candidatus Woesearchaeota archaeon]
MKTKEKQDLEDALKEKVSPLLEETMEKNWGITIPKLGSDITDNLKNPQLNIYIPPDLNFDQAKKHFKGEFVKRELRLNKGNISQLAKLLGVNRRSIHRVIKDLSIDKKKETLLSKEDYQQDVIDKTLRSTLDQYKAIIHPQQMEKMYQEVSTLSRNIAKFIPFEELSWKEAEREFERQFLQQALREQDNNISKTAQKIDIRIETLYRKIKKLGLKG